MERIEKIEVNPAKGVTDLFLSGPVEFLAKSVAEQLVNTKQWKAIFGDFLDGYKRMDYPLRALPALRIYNNSFTKQFESWFIEGDLLLDCIFPASMRRNETQQFQDTMASALVQQFRRETFFNAVSEAVPGLNELGKTFTVDKSLGFEWGEDLVPLTQMTVNFRLDLRVWDQYLEDNYRTKDDPFEKTLADLTKIATTIRGLNDDGTANVEISLEQKPGEG